MRSQSCQKATAAPTGFWEYLGRKVDTPNKAPYSVDTFFPVTAPRGPRSKTSLPKTEQRRARTVRECSPRVDNLLLYYYTNSEYMTKMLLQIKVCLAVLGTLAGTIGKQMVRCSKLAKERRKQKEGNFLLVAGHTD